MTKPHNSFLLIGVVAFLLIGIVSAGSYLFLRTQRSSSNSNMPLENLPDGSLGQACTMEAKICPDGTAVGRTGPNCEFAPCPGEAGAEVPACPVANLRITNPEPVEKVTFPLRVSGVVDNRTNSSCTWGVFEAQAGTMVLADEDGTELGRGVLATTGEWMTTGPISVDGTVTLTRQPTGKNLVLTITEEDPRGMNTPKQLVVPLLVE